MTCEFCNGTGTLPLLNVWKISKEQGKESPLKDSCIWDAPCPECHIETLTDLVKAMLDKYGEPFTDSKFGNDSWHYQLWFNIENRPFVVPVTGESMEEDV